jgi:hypothetical protein
MAKKTVTKVTDDGKAVEEEVDLSPEEQAVADKAATEGNVGEWFKMVAEHHAAMGHVCGVPCLQAYLDYGAAVVSDPTGIFVPEAEAPVTDEEIKEVADARAIEHVKASRFSKSTKGVPVVLVAEKAPRSKKKDDSK